MDEKTPWRKAHRFRLHLFAQNQSDAPLSFFMPDMSREGGPLKMRKEQGTVKDIAEFFYDMKLAGNPLQCNDTDGTCETMAYVSCAIDDGSQTRCSSITLTPQHSREIDFAPHQTPDQLNQYKFMFDLVRESVLHRPT
jgi:hypothetical protein